MTMAMASSISRADLDAGAPSLRPIHANSKRDKTRDTENKQESHISNRSPAHHLKYRHVGATHSKSQPSCLSHDSTVAPSFVGFRNLMVLVLIASNLRLMIENLQKYGVLICIGCHNIRHQDYFFGIGLYVMIPLNLFIAYGIELLAAKQARGLKQRCSGSVTAGSDGPSEDERRRFRRTWIIVAWAHMTNITLALLVTSYVVFFYIEHPAIGTLNEVHAVIVWLKTISYAFTNRDLRHAYLHPAKGELDQVPNLYSRCPYPQNITMSNLCYFWWAPTLVYQPTYPRASTIRWGFFAKRVGETFGLSVAIWILSAQYATPLLFNSLTSIHTYDAVKFTERLLKLSTISLVIWLVSFFAVFHSFLNALAEIMRFGDRNFYDDWWNSPSVGVYWRTWNKPVYSFLRRHVYSPMLGRGWSSNLSAMIVFFFSAVLHEILVGVPTHNILGVAFIGMLFQIPLIQWTRGLEKSTSKTKQFMGNAIFWVTFTILGQPTAILVYFYAWQAKFGNVARELQELIDVDDLALKVLLPEDRVV